MSLPAARTGAERTRRGRRAPLAAILAAAALLPAGAPAAAAPGADFEAANRAYEAGRYQEAAEAYESVLAQGLRDPRVHYNLGNAYYRLGRLGPAILNYERAVRLAPGDAEARENLELARTQIRDRVADPQMPYPVQAVRGLLDRLSLDAATGLFLAAYLVTGALLGWLPLARGDARRRLFGYGAAAFGIAALLLGGGFAYKVRQATAAEAVVMRDRVDVRSGPAEDNTILFTVHEGTLLEVRNRRPGWLQVSLPNALSGWVPAATVETV